MVEVRYFLAACSAALTAFFSPVAAAWGPVGHRIVAELAERQLTPTAQKEIQTLLANESEPHLAGIANWADEIRNDPAQKELFDMTKRLHYVNFPKNDCHYKPERDCRDGQCVVAAIEHYRTILGDHRLKISTRNEALKFLVHFVGDIHQPLHAGRADDRGGNTYQINYHGEGWNLHSVWDSLLIESHSTDAHGYADELVAMKSKKVMGESNGSPADWAMQSCRLIEGKHIYPNSHVINDHYLDHFRPVAEQRLREAGDRLAELLNAVLD